MRDDVCLPVLVCHQSWLSTQVHQPKIWPWEEWLLYFSSLFFQTSSDLFFIHSLLVWHLKNCTRRWHCHTYEFWRKIPNSRQIAMSPHHDRHKSQGGLFSQGLHQQLTSRAIPAPPSHPRIRVINPPTHIFWPASCAAKSGCSRARHGTLAAAP